MNPLEKKVPLAVPPEDYKDPSEKAGAEQNTHTLEELQEGAARVGQSPEVAWKENQQKEIDDLFNSLAPLESAQDVKDKLKEVYQRGGPEEKAALIGMLSEVSGRMKEMAVSGSVSMTDNVHGIEDFLKTTVTEQGEGDVVASSPAPEALKEIDDEQMPISSPGRVTNPNMPAVGFHKESPADTQQEADFFKESDAVDQEHIRQQEEAEE